ncbi:IS6 family transposase, partial [Bacillus cereus]
CTRTIRDMLGLKSSRTATNMIAGIGVMHMVKKGQLKLRVQSVKNQNRYIHQLFGLPA